MIVGITSAEQGSRGAHELELDEVPNGKPQAVKEGGRAVSAVSADKPPVCPQNPRQLML